MKGGGTSVFLSFFQSGFTGFMSQYLEKNILPTDNRAVGKTS